MKVIYELTNMTNHGFQYWMDDDSICDEDESSQSESRFRQRDLDSHVQTRWMTILDTDRSAEDEKIFDLIHINRELDSNDMDERN
jgi:hypothetical protein